VAEGFGGPYASGASDIGTAIIYALVFVCLLTLAAYTGTDRWSMDYYLEQKISWWHKVAEVGHQVQEQPVPAAVVPAQRATSPAATAALPAAQGPAGLVIPVAPALDGSRPEPVPH